MKIQLTHKFEDIISLENLLEAWKEFVRGKRKKSDVQEFSFNLMDNILSLHQELGNHIYTHGGYQALAYLSPIEFHEKYQVSGMSSSFTSP